MPKLLELNWSRSKGGYRIEDKNPASWDLGLVERPSGWLVPIGKEIVRYQPLDPESPLFLRFAETEPTPEGVLEFANEFGLLSRREESSTDLQADPIDPWIGEIELFSNAVYAWERKMFDLLLDIYGKLDLGTTNVRFGFWRGSDHPLLHFEPATLIDALWVQLAQEISASKGIMRCAICSTPFLFGSGTGRRSSSQYCSDRCRKAAWRDRQEKTS